MKKCQFEGDYKSVRNIITKFAFMQTYKTFSKKKK